MPQTESSAAAERTQETGSVSAGHTSPSGTRLVHYGPIWDESAKRIQDGAEETVAVLVCHGMGQQVRYETIGSVAHAILTEAREQGSDVGQVEVHQARIDDNFLARAEISWRDKEQIPHGVHVYEAYWAPLTEGRVTYWDTVKFLLSAAWKGLRCSRPFLPGRFDRWMFEEPRTLSIGSATFAGILCVLLFLVLQVAVIGYVSLELAQQYKAVLSQPLPEVTARGFLQGWFKLMAPLLPGLEQLLHPASAGSGWWWSLVHLAVWLVLIAEVFIVRYFIVEYAGDVAAYVSPYKNSKFDELRHQIQKVGLDVGRVVYGFRQAGTGVSQYGKVVIVGHSLGSVLAYDTLNAVINLDNVSANSRRVVERTRALITFGSPLDKTAFIFRMQARSAQAWIREQLAASMQPLIVSYEHYRPSTFSWVNIWSPMDIISGALNYYDDPKIPADDPRHVQNMKDPDARTPLAAHVQYWNGKLLRQQLYKFVSERKSDDKAAAQA